MQIDANDPRLTAYALNELDAEDRREVSMLLETSPEAREAVEEIRQAADALSRELNDESPLQLTNEQRQTVEQAMTTRRQRRWMPLAVAASLLLVAGSWSAYVLLPSLSRAREVSRRTFFRTNNLASREDEQLLLADGRAQRSPVETESADQPPALALAVGPPAPAARGKVPQRRQLAMESDKAESPRPEDIRYPKNWPEKTARKLAGDAHATTKTYNIEDLVVTIPTYRGRHINLQNFGDGSRTGALGGGRFIGKTNAGAKTNPTPAHKKPQNIGDREETVRQLASLGYTGSAADSNRRVNREGNAVLFADTYENDHAARRRGWSGQRAVTAEQTIPPAMQAKLQQVLPEIDFDAAPLEHVIDVLRAKTGMNIVVNWSALEAAAVERDVEVSLRMNNVTVGKTLDILVHEFGGGVEFDYRIIDDVIEISTKENLDRRRSIEYLNQRIRNAEAYARILDNPFLPARRNPLSTFSIDVDTAAYANVRRFLNGGQFPPADAVRIEEMINYFAYDYPEPEGPAPFSVNVEVADCPWAARHRLVRIGLKGKSLQERQRPACNLVFLIDVSGSMSPQNKLPLLKKALGMLVAKLGAEDRIAIVTYAGASQLALPSTTCNNQSTIRHAMAGLNACGCTNGGAGIQIAYDVATENFIESGVNRVVLATDGDFNVGITDRGELTRLIRQKAQSGVALTVLGFGMGNLKDATLEKLADTGDGNYAYIDTLREAHKVLVEQIGGTLVTIARDVKIQIEFNPQQAQAYRLIGYENRVLAARDFNDDHKDAGEIGAGHMVTALYEVVPVGVNMTGVDPLKYQPKTEPATVPPSKDIASDELLTVKLRYKEPQAVKSRLIERAVTDAGRSLNEASTDFRFAASVASFGMLLRNSPYRGDSSYNTVAELAAQSLGPDANGHRREFVGLVKMAGAMRPR